MTINKKISSLANYDIAEYASASFDDDYQDIFKEEGQRKATYILEELTRIKNRNELDLSGYLYLSIGGSDGSEVESIFDNTEIRTAILIEISDSAAEKAREKSLKIKDKGGELKVLQGDATQRLPDILELMSDFKRNHNIKGLITSCQAVLHELPKRSPDFQLNLFLGQLFSIYQNNIFFGREPIVPERWPNRVEINIANSKASNIEKIAHIINDKNHITSSSITKVANNFVNLDSTLALETLHKIIRANSVEEFTYELGEQLTSFDPDNCRRIMESHLGPGTVRIESMVTNGFMDAWEEHQVKVKNEVGYPLSFPNTHAKIIGISLNNISNNEIEEDVHLSSDTVLSEEGILNLTPLDLEIFNILSQRSGFFCSPLRLLNLASDWHTAIGDSTVEEVKVSLEKLKEMRLVKSKKGKSSRKDIYASTWPKC